MSLPAELFPLLAQSAATDPKAARLLAILSAVDAALAEHSHATAEIPNIEKAAQDLQGDVALSSFALSLLGYKPNDLVPDRRPHGFPLGEEDLIAFSPDMG